MVETPSGEYYRAVFHDAADAILILDDERTIVEANPAAGALVGVSPEALVGRTFEGLLLPEGSDDIHAVWRELMAFGEAKREHRIASAAASRLVECSYRARVQPHRHLCVARDITERRLLQEQLMRSDKIESVGRLAGGIAHDFNNLLTAILGYTELLLSSRRADDPERLDLEEIQKAGQRAAALTQQLLAFSRKQVLRPKHVDLNQTVTSLQSMLGRLIREDIAVQCDLAPTPVVVRIDPHQIEQVILNLVLNARDALPAGGNIRVEVGRVSAAQAGATVDQPLPPGGYARLRVIDDGVGISPEARAHLFEPFFTTKEVGKGTGLGLASVYGIVRQSNGFIAVESEPGRGTTFTMYFPAVAGAHAVERRRKTADRPMRHETVLVVEDEDAVRALISEVLRRRGYQVLEASTPSAACRMFEQCAGEIDLLLSDVVMPEMSGPALAQRLVAERPELRVLFISGYTDVASTPLEANSPNMDFLPKPFQASTLAEKVREILSRPRTDV
jgi:two-component system cell cycle sensor histidine kinase/response regulator CckA